MHGIKLWSKLRWKALCFGCSDGDWRGRQSKMDKRASKLMREIYEFVLDADDRTKDIAASVCTAYLSTKGEEDSLENYGKVSRGSATPGRLIGRRSYETERVPGSDHVRLFIKDGQPDMLLSEPYALSMETVREMLEYAEKWGLSFLISGSPGLHYPGNVVSVQWRKNKDAKPMKVSKELEGE